MYTTDVYDVNMTCIRTQHCMHSTHKRNLNELNAKPIRINYDINMK